MTVVIIDKGKQKLYLEQQRKDEIIEDQTSSQQEKGYKESKM